MASNSSSLDSSPCAVTDLRSHLCTKNPATCAELEKVVTDPVYLTISTVYLLNFVVSMFFVPLVWIRFCRQTAFHRNVKVLISILFMFGIAFSTMGIATCLFHLYFILFPTDACSRIFYTVECAWSFYPLTCCIIGFMLAEASLTVERLIATYRLRNYEKGGRHLGPIMAIIVVIGSISSVAWGLAEVDPGELQYQCGGIPLSTRWRMILIYKTLFFVDALAMITFAFCYYHNAKTLRNGRYELSLRYQIYENLRAIRIFFPLAILHFIIFCLFFLGSITIRELRASLTPKEYGIGVLSLYIFPYYILAMCALLFVVLRKESARLTTLQAAISEGQSEKEQSERHFRTLQDQWTKKAPKG